jgi:hypothetical protein
MKRRITGFLIVGAVATGACKKESEPARPPIRAIEVPVRFDAPRVIAPTSTVSREARTEVKPGAGAPIRAAGSRPAWYPAGFALPAGWRAEGPVSVTPHATAGELAWDKPLSEVLAEFQKDLGASGWTLKTDEPRGKGGKRMRWEKGGETVQLSIFEVLGKARAIVVPPIR